MNPVETYSAGMPTDARSTQSAFRMIDFGAWNTLSHSVTLRGTSTKPSPGTSIVSRLPARGMSGTSLRASPCVTRYGPRPSSWLPYPPDVRLK